MARTQIPVTEVTPPKAALTTALTGANNDLVFTARNGGPGGNSIQVAYIDPAAASQSLSVVVAGFLITVNLATDGASAITSTAAQIASAIALDPDANALVSVANAASNDGTGVVTALTATALTGGRMSTAQPSLVNGDATNDHYITGNDGEIMVEVVSSDAGSQTVTIKYAPGAVGVQDLAGLAETIEAGTTRQLGPFDTTLFNQNADGDVYLDPSVANTLDFRAYRITAAA